MVIDFQTRQEQKQQHVTDDYFKPNDKFYSMDGKQLSEHQMKQHGYEPITTTGKIVKAIVSPLGYIFGLIIAIVTDIKEGTLFDWIV